MEGIQRKPETAAEWNARVVELLSVIDQAEAELAQLRRDGPPQVQVPVQEVNDEADSQLSEKPA